MKARKVKGLDPAAPLERNAWRIVATRLDELCSFDAYGDAQTLHDMRIAAKRLRYVLELMAPALGPDAAAGADEAKAIQTLLGDLHDCDVMLELVGEREALRAYFTARRDLLHSRFLAEWERLQDAGFRERLAAAADRELGVG